MRFVTIMMAAVLAAGPAAAQVRSIDPNDAAQADVAPPAAPAPRATPPVTDPQPGERGYATSGAPEVPVEATGNSTVAPPAASLGTRAAPTYRKDDLIGSAEGVFGKGAAGLAGLIERILRDQGEPNAYIAGREVSGAFVVGLRYGSGTLNHKVEGERPIYWTGPSIGFDVGGDATKVFTLVYNLYDSQDIYRRYPQVEGRAYFVGGFSATYLRRGNIVLIPVRLGVGVRLGANIGYMRFSEKNRLLPF